MTDLVKFKTNIYNDTINLYNKLNQISSDSVVNINFTKITGDTVTRNYVDNQILTKRNNSDTIAADSVGYGNVNNIEFNYLDGVNANIQTQLNAKASNLSPVFSGNISLPSGIWNLSGYVGIGTITPEDSLQVQGNIRIIDGGVLQFGGTANKILGNNASNYLAFYTGGSERLRLNSNGNLGIGIASPSDPLHIYRSGSGANLNLDTPDNWSIARFSKAGVKKWDIAMNTANEKLVFNSNSIDNIIGLQQDGKVGIGTNAPTHKFTISNDNSTINAANATFVIENPTGSQTIQSYTFGGTQKSSIRSDVFGNLTFNTTLGTYFNSDFGDGSFYWTNAGAIKATLTNSGQFRLGDATAPSNMLDVIGNAYISGNVGIGISPSYSLDVNGDFNLRTSVLRINGAKGSNGQVLTTNGNTVLWQTPGAGSGWTLLETVNQTGVLSYDVNFSTSVKAVWIIFEQVGLSSGNGYWGIQLKQSGSAVTTGYSWYNSTKDNAGTETNGANMTTSKIVLHRSVGGVGTAAGDLLITTLNSGFRPRFKGDIELNNSSSPLWNEVRGVLDSVNSVDGIRFIHEGAEGITVKAKILVLQ